MTIQFQVHRSPVLQQFFQNYGQSLPNRFFANQSANSRPPPLFMYNPVLLKHVADPHNMGTMDDAHGIGQVGFPGEGPFMIFYLKVDDEGQIQQAGFETYGCPSAIGCGSWLAHWIEGKTTEEASSISDIELMVVVGGLPLGKEHNATMTIEAFRAALSGLSERVMH